MPKLPDYQGLARISSGKSHMTDNLQYSTRDNMMVGRGSMTEFAASKSSSSSPRKSPYDIKLPSIRSLIEDVPTGNMNGLPHPRSDRLAIAASPSEQRTQYSSTVPRAPSLFSIRTHTEKNAAWDHNSLSSRSGGTNRQMQSPAFSPHVQHINSSEMSSSNLGHQTRLESFQTSRRSSSNQLVNSPPILGSSRTQPAMLPVQQPSSIHDNMLVPRRESYSQMQETAPQQYHQHHISTKTSAIIADQQAQQYVCQQCNKVFSRPSSLKIHGHSHTGEKPFRCPHADCGKTFSVRSNMKRHEKGCHES